MFAQSRTTRILLHLANLVVITFFLLPIFAVIIGSVQSEKSLQADTRRLLPLEFTLDNFTVILTQGENVATGSRLTYNTRTESARLEGGSNGRVQGVFYPNSAGN